MWAIVFGVLFGALCGFTVWMLGETERGVIKNDPANVFLGIILGIPGGLFGVELVRQLGWGGVALSLFAWFIFTCIGGCAAAL